MDLLSFGLKNIGTIQSVINGLGMFKQFINPVGGNFNHLNNSGFNQIFNPQYNPYYNNNPYEYLPNNYYNHHPYGYLPNYYYNHNPYFRYNYPYRRNSFRPLFY